MEEGEGNLAPNGYLGELGLDPSPRPLQGAKGGRAMIFGRPEANLSFRMQEVCMERAGRSALERRQAGSYRWASGGSPVAKGRILIEEVLCKGCELCITVCPKALISIAFDRFTPKGYHPAILVDPSKDCTGCAICSVICPEAAITVYRWAPARAALAAG